MAEMADVALSSPFDDPKSFITLSHALEAVGKYPPVASFSVISTFPFKGPRHTSVQRSYSKTRYARGPSILGPRALIAGSKEYLLAAATILSTESRHSGWLDSAMRRGSAWSGPFDVRSSFRDGVRR